MVLQEPLSRSQQGKTVQAAQDWQRFRATSWREGFPCHFLCSPHRFLHVLPARAAACLQPTQRCRQSERPPPRCSRIFLKEVRALLVPSGRAMQHSGSPKQKVQACSPWLWWYSAFHAVDPGQRITATFTNICFLEASKPLSVCLIRRLRSDENGKHCCRDAEQRQAELQHRRSNKANLGFTKY